MQLLNKPNLQQLLHRDIHTLHFAPSIVSQPQERLQRNLPPEPCTVINSHVFLTNNVENLFSVGTIKYGKAGKD
jgi:hypothetical protein